MLIVIAGHAFGPVIQITVEVCCVLVSSRAIRQKQCLLLVHARPF